MKNFFEDGVKFGEYISECTDNLIVSLIAERARMYKDFISEEESKKFIQGAASAIKNNENIVEKVSEKNKKIVR